MHRREISARNDFTDSVLRKSLRSSSTRDRGSSRSTGKQQPSTNDGAKNRRVVSDFIFLSFNAIGASAFFIILLWKGYDAYWTSKENEKLAAEYKKQKALEVQQEREMKQFEEQISSYQFNQLFTCDVQKTAVIAIALGFFYLLFVMSKLGEKYLDVKILELTCNKELNLRDAEFHRKSIKPNSILEGFRIVSNCVERTTQILSTTSRNKEVVDSSERIISSENSGRNQTFGQ